MNDPGANAFGYAEPIWRRFTRPEHAGVLDAADAAVISAETGTPAASAVIRLSLQLDRGRVAQSRFQAYGCPTTIAVGEWLAERATGRAVEELGRISAADLRAALEIPDDRAHCAVLGEDVLRSLCNKVRR